MERHRVDLVSDQLTRGGSLWLGILRPDLTGKVELFGCMVFNYWPSRALKMLRVAVDQSLRDLIESVTFVDLWSKQVQLLE